METFNFFSCIGLQDLASLEKEKLQKEIDAIIWRKFLLIETVKLLSFEDRKLLNSLEEQKAQKTAIQDFLNSKVPNFSKEYAAFAQKVEVEIIHDHITNLITDAIQVVDLIKENKKKENLEEKIADYRRALRFVEDYAWSDVMEIMRK